MDASDWTCLGVGIVVGIVLAALAMRWFVYSGEDDWR